MSPAAPKASKKNQQSPPSPQAMKRLANRFSAEEWELLSESRDFLDAIAEDLGRAYVVADAILASRAVVQGGS
jgi:hypothetical protein